MEVLGDTATAVEGSTETALRNALAELEQSRREAVVVAQEQVATLTERWQAEVDGYKEQSHQYALTIAAMEERLAAMLDKQQQLQNENESLKNQLLSSQERAVGGENQLLSSQERAVGGESDVSGVVEDEEKPKTEQQLIKTLRHQLALSAREEESHRKIIQSLERDTENQKLAEDELRRQHNRELEDMRKTLSLQENALESQRQEICQLKQRLGERETELLLTRKECGKREREMNEECEKKLQCQLRETKEKWQELIAVGERCLGERHTQALARGKDAIDHLRERLQERQDKKPSEASHAATLAELQRVREELIEERAMRHLEAARAGGESDSDSVSESDPVIDALQHSEDSYFTLVASVCEGGIVKGRPVERKIPVAPNPAERHSVLEDRQQFAERVAKKMQGIAQDMERRRRRKRTDSGDGNSDDESSEPNMEETLSRLQLQLESANEELDQQKRVNLALVKRQEFREHQIRNANRFQKRPNTAIA